MNKQSPATKARLLDAQAMQTLEEVAIEFAVLNSAATSKAHSKDSPTAILTSVVTDTVDRTNADVARADKPEQRADAFAAHILWLSEAALLPGRSYCSKPAGRRLARW